MSFLLKILKWSAGKRFWYKIPVTDKPTLKKAITVKRTRIKLEWKQYIRWYCNLDEGYLYLLQHYCCNNLTNIKQIHNKKFDSLCKKTQQEDGTKENPNNTIWNLTSQLVKWWIPSFKLWTKPWTANSSKRHRHSSKCKNDLGLN